MSRIAVFSLTYPPFVGGAEVAIAEIAKRLPAHQWTVFTARLRSDVAVRETVGAVTVVRIGNGTRWDKYRYPWQAVRAAMAEHSKQPFDLIWGMMASWGGFAALRFMEHSGLPYVLTEQSGDSDAFIARRTWFWRWRYRQIYTRADRVTAISKFLVQRVERFGARNVVLVPNGVDVAHFGRPAGEAARHKLRARMQLTNGPFVITVSRLVEKNGMDDLITAIGLLRQRQVSVNLLVVGSGPLEAALRAQAVRLGLEKTVHFIGFVEHAQLSILLQFSQVFARPSRSEGFGLAFVEAMAAGVPVVATAVGGIPDFIRDGENGLLCRPNDPSHVADAIGRLLRDDALRKRLVANARSLVQERYDWSVIAREMDQVFTSVMSKP